MGWQDREYAQSPPSHPFRPNMRLGGMSLSTKLIIANVAVFFLDGMLGNMLFDWGAMESTLVLRGQIWRLLTYEYLHDPQDITHLLFNMLGLFFFGKYLEQSWGAKRFFIFYTLCGLAGSLFYMLLTAVEFLPLGLMVGASGCVLGVLGACAVLFPQIQVLLYFILPMRIRTLVLILLGVYFYLVITKSANAGGEAAHLAGVLAGGGYALWTAGFRLGGRQSHAAGARPIRARIRKPKAKPSEDDQKTQREIDRILQKIHDQGIASISQKERDFLALTSREQRTRDAQFGRTDQL